MEKVENIKYLLNGMVTLVNPLEVSLLEIKPRRPSKR